MENNSRGKVNALDLVELLIAVVLTWIGEKLLDSLWKGMIGTIRKILAGRSLNEVSRKIMRELGYKILLWEAHILEVDDKLAKLSLDQVIHMKDPMLTSSIKFLVKLLRNADLW